MLRLSAAILLIGGPILALLFRSWGAGALVFGLGAIVLGIRQVRLGGHRSDRFLGVALFSALPCVAPYCAPGGVRVVSNRVSDSGVAAFSDGSL
jgi:hypothetical protein